jgi:hypothetical protein
MRQPDPKRTETLAAAEADRPMRDHPSTPEKNDSRRGPAGVATTPAAPQSQSIHSPGAEIHGR